MRTPIIILALVALSFVAVLVYGVGRDRPRANSANAAQPGAPPPTHKDGSIDEDAMEDWRPPSLFDGLNGMASGYTKGLKMQPEQVSLGGQNQTVQASVNFFRKGEKPKFDLTDTDEVSRNPRTVKLTLISGAMAVINASKPGGSQQLCLCQPGTALSLDELNLCPSQAWRKLQSGGKCRRKDDRHDESTNTLAVYAPGAVLTFTSFRPAQVSSAKK